MRPIPLLGVLLLALVLLAACSDDAARAEMDASMDAASPDAGPPLECTCEEGEDCSACFAHIGRCCYGDELIRGLDSRMPMAEALARRCELDPSCLACCNECTSLTCEELVASQSCPPLNPPGLTGEDMAALTRNGNALTPFTAQPLTTAALAANPDLVDGALGQLALLATTVECALPEGATVTVNIQGTDFDLPGTFGMAPEWADGPCDEACQEWVSGCLLVKINNWNIRVRIYLRTSDHDGVSPGRDGDIETSDRMGFDVEEGGFFGNLFADPPRMYACRGRGRDPLYDVARICSHPDSHCGITPVGPCLPSEGEGDEVPHACETVDEHGALRRCHGRLSRPDGTFPADARTYDRLVTLYIPHTAFEAGLNAAGTCSGDPPPGDHVPRPIATTPAAAGDPCQTDDDCANATMTCRTMNGPGYCTSACENDPDPAAEEAACGPGATCLVTTTGNSHCVQSCVPVSAGGAGCPAGRVCTGFSLPNTSADRPGCANFCTADSECLSTQHCGRDGICVLEDFGGPLADRLPDGSPCTLGGDEICRGVCVPFGSEQGICGSFIDLGDTDACPDDPATISPTRGPDDDLAICVFRRCGASTDCTAPLRCLAGPIGVGSVCTYAM